MTTLTNESTTTPSSTNRFMRMPWLIGGGLAIAAAGVAGGMAWRPAQTELNIEPTKAAASSDAAAKTADGKSVPQKPAGQHASNQAGTTSSGTTPLATQPAAVCATCGVIEGVREVQVKGKGTGLGAVAGGVLGGALGNQVGKGNGRTAMTVLGAVGGGLAGHEVEKRARSETVYEVRVRMDDGSLRTLTQKTAPAPGSRVTVEGNTLRSSRAPQNDSQMVRTSAGA